MTRWAGWLKRLPVQLVGLLTLALFPLGLISILQTRDLMQDARVLNRALLKQLTEEAAGAEREVIREALGAAHGLGAAVKAVALEDCRSVMREFVNVHAAFSIAAYVGLDGMMICTSGDKLHDISGVESFQRALNTRDHAIGVHGSALEEDGPLITVTEPVFSAPDSDTLIGFVAIAIPHQAAQTLINQRGSRDIVQTAVVTLDGRVISASGGTEAAPGFLPKDFDPASVFRPRFETFDALSGDGEPRVYAMSSMVPGQIALIGSWPAQKSVFPSARWQSLVPLAFPVLMWIAGMAVAFYGVQRLVIRHITALRSAMRQYALGELRGGRLELSSPPEELEDTERAFNRMVMLLAEAEARQEKDLRDKEVLLREVHHRVKNNLQLIGSVINMQYRNAKTQEAKSMLSGLQRRVRGLAVLHRTLYTEPEMAVIDVNEMVQALVADLFAATPHADHLSVKTDLDPLHLFPEQAVPLSMLLAEALTNALKYAGSADEGAEAWVAISLDVNPESGVHLAIENSKGRISALDLEADQEPSGLGTRLMRAFASQLEGDEDITETETRYRYALRFRPRDFNADAPAA